LTRARYVTGKVLSHLLNPILINTPVFCAVGLATGEVRLGAALPIILISALLPVGYVVLLHRLGVFSSIFISDHAERKYFYPVLLASAVLSLALAWFLEAPLLFSFLFVSLVVFGVAGVLTLWYKVSLHLAGIAAMALMLGWFWGPWGWLSLTGVPLCAAGRLLLREHTVGEAAAGTALGMTLTWGLLALMGG
jgi:hypothetical protein